MQEVIHVYKQAQKKYVRKENIAIENFFFFLPELLATLEKGML